MDNVEKAVDNIVNYCKTLISCENCVFNFKENLLEENSCGLNCPQSWKGINKDKKDYLIEINKNSNLKEDLQKTKDEVQYYKEIYFGGNVDGKE